MGKDIIQILKDIPLFHGADDSLLESIVSEDTECRDFSSGEEIPVILDNKKNLVIITDGKATVHSADTERKVLLRTLCRGDVFGVAELFGGDDDSISRVVAKGKCSVILISEEKMGKLLENDKNIMYNYLNFLCCRIRFLGKRIACFTAGSAERRLALYLDSLASKEGDQYVAHVSSMEALSHTLDIGRASLYRAVDAMIKDGFIKKEGKNFLLSDRKMMINHYNK